MRSPVSTACATQSRMRTIACSRFCGVDAVGSGDRARELLIEALQRAVEDRAAQHPVDFLVDRRRAAGTARRTTPTSTTPSARGRTRSRRPGFPRAGARARASGASPGRTRAFARRRRRSQPFCSASAAASAGSDRRGSCERAQSLALGRRRLDLPGQRRQRPSVRSGDERRPRRRARARPPRTGSARAVSPRRRRPAARARAAAAAGCTPSRRGIGRGSPDRAARAAHRGSRSRPRRVSSSRNGSTRRSAGGSVPCSSPRTKTVSKRRVRARRRSMTATRPGAPARSPRTEARSSAASTSSAADLQPARARAARARRACATDGVVRLRGRIATGAPRGGASDAVGVPKHRVAHGARRSRRVAVRERQLERGRHRPAPRSSPVTSTRAIAAR